MLRRRDDIIELDARTVMADVAQTPIDLAPRTAEGPGGGSVQLWPHRHGTDAMFLALLQRRTDPERTQS